MARSPATIQKEEIADAAREDLIFFIKLVAPHRVLGSIHEDVLDWWQTTEDRHQLLLMPRDHQKSAMVAYKVIWQITRDPTSTFLYVSATSTLAEKQLYFIKNVMNSKVYQYYFPQMTNPMEGKRDKWTNSEINVDHPLRKREGIRDSTIFTAGLTTTITGLHFTHAVLDDIVIRENAYTEEGRRKVAEYYSLLASIETTGSEEWVVGTRYHPKDLYSTLIEMEATLYDDKDGSILEKRAMYGVKQYEVEDRGDGSGEFLWPRQQRDDGKWFGFNANILAEKKAKYLDRGQFFAQYYNNPNDPSGGGLKSSLFQYYDKKHVTFSEGSWYYNGAKLNVFAAIDFAFSLKKRADYSAIVVIGVDSDNNVYVLDIERFKTEAITGYFERILSLHTRWNFRKLRAEVNVGQQAIVRELKDSYIKKHGLKLSIDEFRPNRHQGNKEERMEAILNPRYENHSVWHYRGGNCQLLETELGLQHPPHDDIKDCLASAIDVAIAPQRVMNWGKKNSSNIVKFDKRFGGVQH